MVSNEMRKEAVGKPKFEAIIGGPGNSWAYCFIYVTRFLLPEIHQHGNTSISPGVV
jgi:hypothetical protein